MGRLFRLGYTSGSLTHPTDIAGCVCCYDARRETPQTDDTDLETPTQLVASGPAFTQGTAANMPHYRTGANGIGGQPAYEFFHDGVNYSKWAVEGWTVAAGDKTVVAVLDIDTATGDKIVFDTETGRIIASIESGTWQFFNDTWRDTGVAATTGPQVLTFVLKATNLAAVYKNLTALGTTMNYSALGIGNTTAIGATQDTNVGPFDGLMGVHAVYDNAISDSDRTSLVSSLMSQFVIS